MTTPAIDARTAHAAGVERLLASYRAVPPAASVRLAKPTSNLFRSRTKPDTPGLDTSGLTGVIAVDPEARTADVAGMCTYADLVAATLPHGLAPLVVPQLKTITLGGAVTGLGIESTSFRNGLPHESVLELDILAGTGEVVTASPTEHDDLYRAFPNSYGTLGYAVRLRIELEPVEPFVEIRHVRFHSLPDLVAAMGRIVTTGEFDGHRVDYLDGVVFSATEGYLCLGTQTAAPGPVSDYTGQKIYYRSIQHDEGTTVDRLTIHDYLWRWDTDWFWCSEAFGAQRPLVRRLWPKTLRRSSFYGRLMRYEQRFHIGDRLERLRNRPPRERVVQDVEIPIERCAEFLDWFLDTVPIEPIWLCPLRLRDDGDWPLYPLRPRQTYVNVGFWSTVPVGSIEGATNRLIEAAVSEFDGHKSLYSDSYYSPERFDELYGGDAYRSVKNRYDPDSRLLDLYAKAVQRR
ncbi:MULTISPECIES: FAD-binding oxidoreductase [unclassified Cryobacterium]|uniref:FAD-binding oxidoreductase n=1 Tax=unclassified Cryobacterium TaxID=2649013 RepID=UPI002AB55E54|nr:MULTISPECIES: FAD-binding oxidoreductase [unclassified Cryobacterium]MDY7543914.1 FAD-binding oxidoreductase [Cryobacterium sp. 5B3]MEA9997645.1 FAD-binding oxidoreductase [Cryobacterium sp. RTS3]MEB0264501.1 FAD-binding oxidoreductase [Cryobacterium sp. 10I5]MEB0273626.1 FAD-binding oxidoreductase [Cryobacterium sp. 5B3]